GPTTGSGQDDPHRRHAAGDTPAAASHGRGRARFAADGQHGCGCGTAPRTDDRVKPLSFPVRERGKYRFYAWPDCFYAGNSPAVRQPGSHNVESPWACGILPWRPSFGASLVLARCAKSGSRFSTRATGRLSRTILPSGCVFAGILSATVLWSVRSWSLW